MKNRYEDGQFRLKYGRLKMGCKGDHPWEIV